MLSHRCEIMQKNHMQCNQEGFAIVNGVVMCKLDFYKAKVSESFIVPELDTIVAYGQEAAEELKKVLKLAELPKIYEEPTEAETQTTTKGS